ncbi:hypothetical protein E2C01_064684 [Portunus trituberculatus]|uniref:Uncharacterized protein n=1 Tax=Portunus trituberculatus TaxID=210409 RepID=A0A5B7HLH4_PORTR|nr:hypothetical protein [Portunus trituberculatus]
MDNDCSSLPLLLCLQTKPRRLPNIRHGIHCREQEYSSLLTSDPATIFARMFYLFFVGRCSVIRFHNKMTLPNSYTSS